MAAQPEGPIRSVVNSLRILEAISAEQPVGVSQLARSMDLPKTSVHRALKTLEQVGWIRSVGDDNARWQLTSRLLAMSLRAYGEYTLQDFAASAMADLGRRTGETVYLVSLVGDSGLVLARVDGQHSVRAYVELGTRLPLHATGSGLAMLAFMPDGLVDELLAGDLESYGDDAAMSPAEIKTELDVVRERGYAVMIGKWRGSIASPIFDADGLPVGALSVAIPVNRFTDSPVDSYGQWVSRLSREIGPVPRSHSSGTMGPI